MDRAKPQGPDTSCSRKLHHVEVYQREKSLKTSGAGHGCDCQLGDLTCVDHAQA